MIRHVPGMDVSFHTLMLPAEGPVPEWLHLLPSGTFYGRDGRGPYKVPDAETLIRVSMAEGKLALDENHATDYAMTTGQPSPARGWIVELQARADGIWGRMDWNEDGQVLMSKRSYKGVSPVFTSDKAGNVTRIFRAALTNTPNLPQLATIHSEGPMDVKEITKRLGLPETATPAEIYAAIDAKEQKLTLQSTQLTAMQTGTVPMSDFVSLQTQFTAMQNERVKERSEAVIDKAIAAGKPIAPLREKWIAMHMASAADTEAMLDGLVSLHAGGMPKTKPSGNAADDELMSEMTDSDLMTCKKMGLDPKKFAENKRKQKEGIAA